MLPGAGTNVPPDLDPPYVEPILGIVFDLDGTLIDSHHDFLKMRRAVIAAAEAEGLPEGSVAPTPNVPTIMTNAAERMRTLHLPETAIDRFEAEAHVRIDAIELEALPTVVARPGAAALLRELTQREYRLGVLTRASDRFCTEALTRTGLAGFFPFLRTRSARGPAKPNSDALLILLREMEVPVDRAILVGDHVMDAETAVGARVRFYGVLAEPPAPPEAPSVERLRAAGAHAVARDLAQLARQLGLPPLGPDRPPVTA